MGLVYTSMYFCIAVLSETLFSTRSKLHDTRPHFHFVAATSQSEVMLHTLPGARTRTLILFAVRRHGYSAQQAYSYYYIISRDGRDGRNVFAFSDYHCSPLNASAVEPIGCCTSSGIYSSGTSNRTPPPVQCQPSITRHCTSVIVGAFPIEAAHGRPPTSMSTRHRAESPLCPTV